MGTPAKRERINAMSGINDFPAFPMPAAEHSQGGHFEQNGMTLRDYFAGQALSNLAARYHESPFDSKGTAKISYEIADAMIAERAKGQPK